MAKRNRPRPGRDTFRDLLKWLYIPVADPWAEKRRLIILNAIYDHRGYPDKESFADACALYAVWQRSKGRCGICGERVRSPRHAQIDHIIPLARGGEHHPTNLQLSHKTCNLRKGTKIL